MKRTIQLALAICLSFSITFLPKAFAQSVTTGSVTTGHEAGISVPIVPSTTIQPLPNLKVTRISKIQPILEPKPIEPVNYTTEYKTPAVAPTNSCGDNFYAHFIYEHESGCSLYNPNSTTGACGLGQANPCSKLRSVCPGLTYACENSFFNNYATSTYGSWAHAYAVWVNQNWW